MPDSGPGLKWTNTGAERWSATLATTFACVLGAAFFWTYLPRYFVTVGWSSAGIGLVLSVAMIVRTFAMPVWARWAERTSSATRVVQLVSTLGAVILWALPFVESTWAVYLVFCALYATWNAFLPLADALTLRQLGADKFGRIRAFGSVGFGAAAIGVAIAGATQAHAVVAGWAPWVVAVLGSLGAASTWLFPRDEVTTRAPDLPQAFALLRRPIILWMVPLWAAHWAAQAPYNLFLVFLCEQREMGGSVPGLAVAAGIFSEVVVLAFGHRLVDRFGPRRLFAIACVATALRWFATALVTTAPLLIALQTVHGLSFGAFLLAAMALLDREIVAEVRASGQALLYVFVFGGGSAVGNAAAGWAVDAFGASSAFLAAGAVDLVLVALLMCMPRSTDAADE